MKEYCSLHVAEALLKMFLTLEDGGERERYELNLYKYLLVKNRWNDVLKKQLCC